MKNRSKTEVERSKNYTGGGGRRRRTIKGRIKEQKKRETL
jgi:hypothetical protein